jgi:glycosyltransferase involved in cell wall biosynthesis
VIVAPSPGKSGLVHHTIDMAQGLALGGHRVTVLATLGDLFSGPLAGTPVEVVDLPLPEKDATWPTLRAWLRGLKPFAGPRAIYTRGVGGSSSLAVLLALRRWFGRLYTIEHATADLPQIAWGAAPLSRGLARRVKNRLSSALVYRSISVSEAVRQSILRVLGFDAARSVTCLNWVDPARFRPDPAGRERVRASLGVGPGDVLVGFLGRVAREKRPDLLVKGFAEFSRRHPGASHLAIVGPQRMAELPGLAASTGLGDRIRFVEWVDDPEAWHNAFDVEVLTSYAEPFGLSVLEAMSCGALVLANDAGGVGEYMRHEENGFLVPLADAADVCTWLTRIAALPRDRAAAIQARARATVVEGYGPRTGLARLLDALDAPEAAAHVRAHGLAGR